MTRTSWIAVGGVSTLALALAVALVIAIAGADGDEDGPREPGAPQIITPGAAPSEELRECMEENGVEPPEPGTSQQGPPEGLEEAFEACRDLLPEGAGPGGPGFRIAPG